MHDKRSVKSAMRYKKMSLDRDIARTFLSPKEAKTRQKEIETRQAVIDGEAVTLVRHIPQKRRPKRSPEEMREAREDKLRELQAPANKHLLSALGVLNMNTAKLCGVNNRKEAIHLVSLARYAELGITEAEEKAGRLLRHYEVAYVLCLTYTGLTRRLKAGTAPFTPIYLNNARTGKPGGKEDYSYYRRFKPSELRKMLGLPE